jgi:hypothetical protein
VFDIDAIMPEIFFMLTISVFSIFIFTIFSSKAFYPSRASVSACYCIINDLHLLYIELFFKLNLQLHVLLQLLLLPLEIHLFPLYKITYTFSNFYNFNSFYARSLWYLVCCNYSSNFLDFFLLDK